MSASELERHPGTDPIVDELEGVLAADRGPVSAGPWLKVERPEFIDANHHLRVARLWGHVTVGDPITPRELDGAASRAGVKVEPGDVVVVRGGQEPFQKALLTGKTTQAAWRSKPSFYAVSTEDRTIPDIHQQRTRGEQHRARQVGAGTHP